MESISQTVLLLKRKYPSFMVKYWGLGMIFISFKFCFEEQETKKQAKKSNPILDIILRMMENQLIHFYHFDVAHN